MAKVVYKSGQQVRLEVRARSKEKGGSLEGGKPGRGQGEAARWGTFQGWTQVVTQPGKGLTKCRRQPGRDRKPGRCPAEGLMQVGEGSQAGAQTNGRI